MWRQLSFLVLLPSPVALSVSSFFLLNAHSLPPSLSDGLFCMAIV